MYLKSLDLQGFKSFPDRIRLDFNKGITAVVGPNGSGKSNIGDAVRWVLGEQSSKTLRGAKMEDVIFAGTQFRKPMGFASVTLTIDNSDRTLDSDSEEVYITRKLYRSGESEYLINGSQVRLKDVAELFMDTGLGRDGYSIIGQGRIAEIVSAKSGERRDIFEEAAGISKFRYRKEEAERRLSQAEENLVRLRDIKSMLENRVEPLRVQSEKAERFIKLSEEKKSLELSVWARQLENLSGSLHKLEDDILRNQAEYNNLENDITQLESAIDGCYSHMQESSAAMETLQNAILEREKDSGRWHSQMAVAENDIAHARESTEALVKRQEETAASEGDIERSRREISQKLEELDRELERLTTELKSAEEALSSHLNEAGGINKSAEDYANRLNQLYIQQSEYRFTITSSASSKQELESQKQELEVRRVELLESHGDLSREGQEIAKGLKVLAEKHEEHTNKLNGFADLREDRKNKAREASQSADNIQLKIREKEHRIKLLEDLENSLEGFQHSVRAVLKAGRSGQLKGVKGSVGQLIQVDPAYTVAIETVLGGSLQHVVVEDEESAKGGIRMLKDQNGGRATFLPMTSIKGSTLNEPGLSSQEGYVALGWELASCEPCYANILKNLLGRIVVARDLDSATRIAKSYGYKFRIVTLDGQMINAGGSFTGGSTVRSAGVLSRRNEITQLKEDITALISDMELAKESASKWQSEAERYRFDMEVEREELSRIQEDRLNFQSEEKRVSAMEEQYQKQAENLDMQLKRFEQRFSEQAVKVKQVEELLTKCEEEINSVQRQLAESQGRQDDYMHRRETLSEEISAMKLSHMELSKDREAKGEALNQLEANILRLADSKRELNQQLEQYADIIRSKEQEIIQCKESIEGAAAWTENTRLEIAKEQARHQEAEQKLNGLNRERRVRSEEKEGFSREESRLQERKGVIQRDYDGIIAAMWDQYQVTRSEAMKSARSLEEKDLPDSQRELNEIKNRIRGLGSVNVAAIEEYKEVSAQFKELQTQLEDVEGSKSELERLIQQLTDSMREQFQTSFDAINRNFQRIFVELFGGGRAMLVLSDTSDVLNSGIEIHVAPPGKVIKNLSLLSGGEQAFVAIAIYFAILKIKPAPFCILDEIEAALDDVNVVRYAQYLRNFISTTQFILVTHRRGSMEEADTLYGVTMQEKGISRLLKMDHGDLNDMAT